MTLRKLIPVSVLGIAALALAGCGVFDGDDDDSPAPAVSMSDVDMTDDDAPDGDAGPSAQTLEDKRAALAALGEDATDEERAAAQKEVDDALRLEGNEAELIASLQEEIDRVNEEAEEVLAKAAKDERIARELAIGTAIKANRVGTATDKAFPNGITEQAVTRDAAGAIAVDVNGIEDDEYSGGEATAGSDAWNSVTMTKADATETEDTVVFYTDIAAPEDKLFTAQYNLETRANILGDPERVKKAQSDSFPAGANTRFTYGATDGRPGSFTGSFDGVPGSFVCTATGGTCTLETNAMGALGMSEDWRFTPNAPNTATVKDPDVAYAYFGWWLNKPKDNAGIHDVEVFSGGTAGHMAAVNDEIEGTATYSGPAAGKYVTKSFTAGVHSDSGVGHFTARANLTARFGLDDAAGTIGGTVTDFMLDDTSPAPWSVMLEDATLTANNAGFTGTTEVNFGGEVTKNDVGATHPGTWQGSFYDDADAADDTNKPGTVAGTFDADTTNASVIGGFGATLQ